MISHFKSCTIWFFFFKECAFFFSYLQKADHTEYLRCVQWHELQRLDSWITSSCPSACCFVLLRQLVFILCPHCLLSGCTAPCATNVAAALSAHSHATAQHALPHYCTWMLTKTAYQPLLHLLQHRIKAVSFINCSSACARENDG